MSNNGNTEYNNLFSSLISDVKSYIGTDPLLPWLRGIKTLKDTLPPRLLKEKLPRFLQKCSESFIADRRYSNDLRYLRVWLHLMDFVDDPKSVLRTMEKNQIGMKKSLFYQAYALYYEKMKRFDAAEKIYHLGVQNLAEPADELQKSYEQFLLRLERHKNKRVQLQGKKTNSRRLNQGDNGNSLRTDDVSPETEVKFANTGSKAVPSQRSHNNMPMQEANLKQMAKEPSNIGAVNEQFPKNSVLSDSRVKDKVNDVLTVFSDESLEQQPTNKSMDEIFAIYVDGKEANAIHENVNKKSRQGQEFNSVGVSSNHALVFARPNDLPSECSKEPHHTRLLREDTVVSRFVGSTISDEPQVENVCHHGLVEPTINLKEAMDDINNMFGEPIEYARKSRTKRHEKAPAVESNCGEFMILADDEPDDMGTKCRTKRHEKAPAVESNSGEFMILADDEPDDMGTKCSREKVEDMMSENSGFLILADDESDNQEDNSLPSSSSEKGSDLFEKTVCTKEAMAEINKLFAMPMDF